MVTNWKESIVPYVSATHDLRFDIPSAPPPVAVSDDKRYDDYE
jgi:hypothetical protein